MTTQVDSAHSTVAAPPATAAKPPATANAPPAAIDGPWWLQAGCRYYAYNLFLRRAFGRRVHKVTLDAGFTCPNVDGTLAVGGCVYCDNRSFSPNRRLPAASIRDQLYRGIDILTRRYAADRFIAYFQAATNTYAPVEHLRGLYDEALDHPQVVGLAIGTRPDCVPDEVLDLIESYASRTFVSLELGMQTVHDRSLEWMNRACRHEAFVDAVGRANGRGFELCAHVILGLPGEARDDMLATAGELARLGLGAVKIHNLHVVRNTPLERMHRAGAIRMLELNEYVALLVDFLELLPPNMVVQRLFGDAPPDYLVAPRWCLDKPECHRRINAELVRRDTWQGRRFSSAGASLA